MHANAALLDKLFTALREHKPLEMASCYHPLAHFRDIAFDLRGVDEIYDMWRMICRPDTAIEVDFDVPDANDRTGYVRAVEKYNFGASERDEEKGVAVTNKIESRFVFEDGLIKSQIDDCDPKEWARQAMGGGVKAYLAGRFRLVRSNGAKKKLRKFRAENPE